MADRLAKTTRASRRGESVGRRRADDLGLRRALSDRLLPLLVAAMIFLASLAVGGLAGSAALARHWRYGAAAEITVQLPDTANIPTAPFAAIPGIARAERLDDAQLANLLRPWLGADPKTLSLRLPVVFDIHLTATANQAAVLHAISQTLPAALIEQNGAWLARLAALGRSLEACAALALGLVMIIAAALMVIATRAGLAARRDAIFIVHALGATDATIAWRFASRMAVLAGAGGALGALAAIPVLLALARLAAPFSASQVVLSDAASVVAALPTLVWAALPALALAACGIGFITANLTVRVWLARLP